jgi:N-acyl-D-amino-acid deacylase
VFDILIVNGTILDGSGEPGFKADVGITGDRIAAVGRLRHRPAARTVDAAGLYVTPGFMDIHTHSDESVVLNPFMESKIRQGVTLEVGGNCGESPAPLLGEAVPAARKVLARYGYELDWATMDEYLRRVEAGGISNNFATLVGNGTLRTSVMGGVMREPTAADMFRMRRLLADSMRAGAWGLSSGLIYPPSSYAGTRELVQLAKVAARFRGIYATHIRNESECLLEAVAEAIAIGEQARIPVEIAHHKAAGRAYWGTVKESLALIASARQRGVRVTCDQYPYTASNTGLSVVIPDWAHEGGADKMVERLRDPDTRARIAAEMREARPGWENVTLHSGWRNILISSAEHHRELEGKTALEVAQLWGQDPAEAAMDLLIAEEGSVGVCIFSMCEEDVQTVMRAPFVMVGSDASAKAPYGPLSEGKPHPRAYGTFPRVLGRYVRDLGVLSWEEAVRKMTSAPAAKLGIARRGLLQVGNFADVVVFDPATVADRGTFVDPHLYPAGIEYVLVNGIVTIERGEHTGALAGRVLRRGRLEEPSRGG